MGLGMATGESASHMRPGLGKNFLHWFADCTADCVYMHHACWPVIPPDVAIVCYIKVSVCYHASHLHC